MKKYFIMILATVFLLSSLAACTPQTTPQPDIQPPGPVTLNTAADPDELLVDTLDALLAAQSLELNTKTETNLNMEGQTQKTSSDINVILHAAEPISVKATIDLVSTGDISGDLESQYEAYMVTENGDLYAYTKEGSNWMKEKISTIDMNLFIENPIQKFEYFVNGLQSINDLGTETIDGKETRVLELISHPAIFTEYATEFINQFGLNYDQLKDCGDFVVKAWITADGLAKYEIDMTNNIQKLADKLANSESATEETKANSDFIKGISLKLSNTILSVNVAPEVTLPAGTEMALEIEVPSTLDQTITITQEELAAAKAAEEAKNAGQ